MFSSTSNHNDFQITCRSCLRISNELWSLDCYPNCQSDDNKSNMSTTKTAGELMMACTNVEIASDDGLPQNVCMECMSDLKAAFAYKTMCEESDAKLRSILNTKSVKLEENDKTKNAEQELKITDTDEYPFEVNWFPSLEVEVLEIESNPKITEKHPESSKIESEIATPTESTALAVLPIQKDSAGNDSPDKRDEDEVKSDESETFNEASDKSPKQNVQSGKGGKDKPKKEKNFLCEYCSGTFYSIGQLNIHYVTHTGRKDFICDICKKQYSTKSCLKDHMRNHGDKSKLYSHLCSCCGRGFAYRKALAEHMYVHSGERPFKCNVCSSAFHTRQNLRMHKKQHEPGRRYVCKTCGKGFIKNNKLIIHMRTHTGERPYTCSECDRKFSQNSTLRAHMRVHTGEKHYSCNLCDESFIQNYQLVSHRSKMGHWIPGTEPPPKKPRPVKWDTNRRGRTKKANNELVSDTDIQQQFLQ